MASIIPGFEYDIFISYRQKDNKGDRWVSKFVDVLKTELEATFKEDISIYFDENPHDRLQETHNVEKSLEGKLKCLIFIPVLSQTYCDPNSYAWQNEFLAFVKMAENDRFGKDVKLRNGNVTSRILSIRIHDLEPEDVELFEKETGSVLRALEFVFRTSTGVSRPLKAIEDHPNDNLNKTFYSDQINKVALAVKEIILALKIEATTPIKERHQAKETIEEAGKDNIMEGHEKPVKGIKRKIVSSIIIIAVLLVVAIFAYPKIFKRNTLERLRSSGEKISIAVMPFKNMTNDTTLNVWQDGIQDIIINSLSSSQELKVKQTESVRTLFQGKRIINYASMTPSMASTISQKLDANVFIYGSIKKSGNTLRINAQLIDSKTEEVFKPFQAEGTADKILPIIDSLSKQVRNFLVISKLGKEIPHDFQYLVSTNSPEAYKNYILGENLFMKRDFARAETLLTQALKIDSNFIFAGIMLSFTYTQLGSFDRAKKWCLREYNKREHMSEPQKMWVDYLYAYLFETTTETIKYLKLINEIDDQLPINRYDLGWAYYMLGQYEKSIQELEIAQKIYNKWDSKPVWAYNYLVLGWDYHKTGMYKKEKELYKEAEKDFPDDLPIIHSQAILSLTEGNDKAANSYIEKYKSLCKENSWSEKDITTDLAGIYSGAGMLEKAEQYYRQALSSVEFTSDNSWYFNNLAWFLIDKGRNIEEGMTLVDKVLKLNPDDYNYLHTKGFGLYKQGKYMEALEILQKSWDLRMKNAIYNHSAYLHLEEAKKAVASQKKN